MQTIYFNQVNLPFQNAVVDIQFPAITVFKDDQGLFVIDPLYFCQFLIIDQNTVILIKRSCDDKINLTAVGKNQRNLIATAGQMIKA